MKLVLSIVSKDDSSMVSSALTQEGFSVTKLATTGGFLMAGNTTVSYTHLEDISEFADAGADVILLPAPGTVPGVTMELSLIHI